MNNLFMFLGIFLTISHHNRAKAVLKYDLGSHVQVIVDGANCQKGLPTT